MKQKNKKNNSKCYRKECANPVTHKWFPNKTDGHLLMCKEHFDELCAVYLPEFDGKEGNLIIVKNT